MKAKIDFKHIAELSLSHAEHWVPEWLPNGHREGQEWRAGDVHGSSGSSLGVNLKSGVWSDFASGEKGGDLISLYAAIYTGGDQLRAAKELEQRLGISTGSSESDFSDRSTPSSQSGPGLNARAPKNRKGNWIAQTYAPHQAGPMPVAHPVRGKPEAVWQYKDQEGRLIGAVYRFKTSTGGKEVLPCVWAIDQETQKAAWRWLSFPKPRPLYGLWRLSQSSANDNVKPVLIVEGEKCADAAQAVLGDSFDVVTWPGGGKAVSKADFQPLIARRVIIWPDSDAQRYEGGELKPRQKQPGIMAAEQVSTILKSMGCIVSIIDIPNVGETPDGWDVADFIDQGADAKEILAWMRARIPRTTARPEAGAASQDDAFQLTTDERPNRGFYWGTRLIYKSRGEIEDCKENVVIALEDHPQLKGLVAYNEFSSRIEKISPAPWDKLAKDEIFKSVEWQVHDDRELSVFLAMRELMMFRSTNTVAEGVEIVANRNKIHPVRTWLESVSWDGVDRNSTWLIEMLGVQDTPYARLVGSLWLRQCVNRIFNPGCQGDYVLILEGTQGLNKSTALRRLGGDYYSDAPIDLNSKDSLMTLAGTWIYEIAELDAFNRVESTRIKQFITQTTDRFRPPYGRRFVSMPRQTVFAGTTNNYEYHKDPTGNRRFWSVLCTKINLDMISDVREQMFAQAANEVISGEPCYPTRTQERELIMPQQEQREIVDLWHQPIAAWLADAGQCMTNEFTSFEILAGAIKMPTDKMDGQRSAATRVGNCMSKLGWVKRRPEKNGHRTWVYIRPESERLTSSATCQVGEADEALPF